jgi:hypothetical protein
MWQRPSGRTYVGLGINSEPKSSFEYTGRYARIWDNLPTRAWSRKSGFDVQKLAPGSTD